MKSLIFRLRNKSLVIKLRSTFRRLIFWFHKRRYVIKEQIGNLSETAIIIFSVFLNSIFPLILSSFTVWLIWFVTNKNELPTTVPIGNETSYDTLLITIVSTTGIFLSLYFSGLNTVVAGIYAKSSSRIRNLFIQEKFGNLSIKFITWLTLSSLGLLLLGVISEFRPAWGLIPIVVSGCIAILVFIQLSRSAFRFFDPTTFCNQFEKEFHHYVKLASSESHPFTVPSFQQFFYNQARNIFTSYHNLLKIVINEEHLMDQGLTNLLKSLGTIYVQYIPLKEKIPTKSRWFELDHVYKDWYLSESHLVSIFLSRRRELPFTEIYNYDWVEQEIEDIILNIIASSKVSDDIKKFAFNILDAIFKVLGQNGCVDNYISLHNRISRVCNDLIQKKDKTKSYDILNYKQMTNPQIVDILCSFQTNFLISWGKYLENLSLSKLENRIDKINWRTPKAVYNLSLPFNVIDQIEDIGRRLNYEIKIERKMVTPDWFIVELISRIVFNYLTNSIEEIIKYSFEYLSEGLDTYKETSDALILAYYLSRAQEFANEISAVVKQLGYQLPKFSGKKINDFEWNEWDYAQYLERIDSFNNKLVEIISENLMSFGDLEFDGRNPDFFGKFLVILSEECIASLAKNDYEKFSLLFPDYFNGCLKAYGVMFSRAEQKVIPHQFRNTFAFDPIIDLFYISGYALLYSEYFQNKKMWEFCKNRWDMYSQVENAVERINVLADLYKYHRSSFITTARTLIRTSWDIDFSKTLQSLPAIWGRSPRTVGRRVPDHPSEIIRIVGENLFLHADELFLDFYFGQNEVSKDVNFAIGTHLSSYLNQNDDFTQNEMDSE